MSYKGVRALSVLFNATLKMKGKKNLTPMVGSFIDCMCSPRFLVFDIGV